jgi:hypothetical protein
MCRIGSFKGGFASLAKTALAMTGGCFASLAKTALAKTARAMTALATAIA